MNYPIPKYLVIVSSEPHDTQILSYDKNDLAGLLKTIKIEKMSIYEIGQKNILDENFKEELYSILKEQTGL